MITLEDFLCKVNRVTAYYRHGNKPLKKDMDALCNAQIELEAEIKKFDAGKSRATTESEYNCNYCDNLDSVNGCDKLKCSNFERKKGGGK